MKDIRIIIIYIGKRIFKSTKKKYLATILLLTFKLNTFTSYKSNFQKFIIGNFMLKRSIYGTKALGRNSQNLTMN